MPPATIRTSPPWPPATTYFLHGTIVGSATPAAGRYANGLNCTGGAMRVVVRPPKAGDSFYPLNTDGGLSIAAWVQLKDATAATRCIASATSGGTLNWAVYASNATGNVEATIAGRRTAPARASATANSITSSSCTTGRR